MLKQVTDFELPENTVLFRAARKREVENRLKKHDHLLAQLSTSTNELIKSDIEEQTATLIDADVELITIYAHKGVKGLFIGNKSRYYNEQSEYILAPNNYYRWLNRGRGYELEIFASEEDLRNAEPVENVDQRLFGTTFGKLLNEAKKFDKRIVKYNEAIKNARAKIGTTVFTKKLGKGKVTDFEIIDHLNNEYAEIPVSFRYIVNFQDSVKKWAENVVVNHIV